MPPEIKQMNRRIEILENLLFQFTKTERYVFEKDVQFQEGRNIQTGTTTGTKFGTDANQKLSFFNATPIAQGGNITLANTPGPNYVQSEMINISTRLNTIILRQEALGFNAS